MPKFFLKIFKSKDFEKSFGRLPKNLQILAIKRIALFKKNPTELRLKTHKLKGELKGFYSFSVNQQYRVLFEFLNKSKNKVLFYDIGTHGIYK